MWQVQRGYTFLCLLVIDLNKFRNRIFTTTSSAANIFHTRASDTLGLNSPCVSDLLVLLTSNKDRMLAIALNKGYRTNRLYLYDTCDIQHTSSCILLKEPPKTSSRNVVKTVAQNTTTPAISPIVRESNSIMMTAVHPRKGEKRQVAPDTKLNQMTIDSITFVLIMT